MIALPNDKSTANSEMGDTEFDFDLEVINTAAYRQVFNKARSKLRSDEPSQQHCLLHSPIHNDPDASQTIDLPQVNIPSVSHLVGQRDTSSVHRPNVLLQDAEHRYVTAKQFGEDVRDISIELQYQEHDAEPEDQSTPRESRDRIGNYILGRTIGEGRHSTVKLAVAFPQKRDDPPVVAIKLISRESLLNSSLWYLSYASREQASHEQTSHEQSFLENLEHANIVRLHETIRTEKHVALVLEYISGGTLTDYVTFWGNLNNSLAQRLFAQIVAAVGYLHRRGIAHLALSCRKVVLDRNQNVVLTGFSHVDVLNPLYKGSPFRTVENGWKPYRKPSEQIYSAPEGTIAHIDGATRADVWSCGVILVSTRPHLSLGTNRSSTSCLLATCHSIIIRLIQWMTMPRCGSNTSRPHL